MVIGANSSAGGGLAQNYALALSVAIGLVYAVFYQMDVHTEICLIHVITVASVALAMCSTGYRQTPNTVALISNGINLIFVSILTLSVTLLSINNEIHYSQRITKTYLPVVYGSWINPEDIVREDLILELNSQKISLKVVFILNHIFMTIAFGALQWVIWLAHKNTKVSPQNSAMYTAILYGIMDALPFILELILVIKHVYHILDNLFTNGEIHIISGPLVTVVYFLIHVLVMLILAPAASALTIAAKFTRGSVFYLGGLICNALRLLFLVILLVLLSFIHAYGDVKDFHITIGRDQAFPGDSIILALIFTLACYGFFEYVIWRAYKDNDSSGQVAPTHGRAREPKPTASSQGLTTVQIDVAKQTKTK